MRGYFWILAVTALCFSAFDATAQVTKGLHFYMPFNEGKGKVAKDVGPKDLKPNSTTARNSLLRVRWEVQLNFRRVPH